VINRETGDEKTYDLKQHEVIIGRSRDCQIRLDSKTTSRQHAKLHFAKGLVTVEDLKSGNGTLLNGEKIAPGKRHDMKLGDELRVEEFSIKFTGEDVSVSLSEANIDVTMKDIPIDTPQNSSSSSKSESASQSTLPENNIDATDPEIIEMKMIKKILGAFEPQDHPTLFVTSEPHDKLTLVFDDNTLEAIIGREPSCSLTIPSGNVSRENTMISQKWGGFVIEDLDSKNGTLVNGKKITQESKLNDGDVITVGSDIEMIFKNPKEFQLDPIKNSILEKDDEVAAKPERTKLVADEPKVNSSEKPGGDQKKVSPVLPEDESEKEKSSDESETPSSDSDQKADEADGNQDKEKPASKRKEKPAQKKKPSSSLLSSLGTMEKVLLIFGVMMILLILFLVSQLI
jgi:pSer/pThr/pTyr-binding forkhead associated (FHA) protein